MRFPKVILERASYPPVTFTGRLNNIQNKQISRKGKQRGVNIKKDVLQSCCSENADWIAKPLL
jgi:hypothetical protein